MMFCRDICNHFIKITRRYNVIRTQGNARRPFVKKENYNRCGFCNILLNKSYDICPCCDNKRLSLKHRRDLWNGLS